ncbi:tetratricopeptide repeat protein [Thalassobacter stenotrophicus]|uniref:tetratricopeptide repeat protein n=1 Tax=Thalassobacter stenotrophicus TaxID=266809 RepID=UPI0022A95A14|nr:tetratricopeptide repeat protein [Thalassobacter stenotrophicus]UYP66721.1 tetratricopeptide repeat protein [Thalassobacter stenotrophicus]
MEHPVRTLNRLLAILCAGYVTFVGAAHAQGRDGDARELLETLREAPVEEAARLTGEILERWSHSGSAALDYLLSRGRDALDAEDYGAAIEHLTALTDHAPDFAEGWNARGTAFFLTERFGLAAADLERALVLNPNHFGALSGLGVIYERIDQPKAALQAFEEALKIHPHMEDVRAAVERLRAQTQGVAL